MDKSELAIATSQIQNPIPFLIELLFNLLSQMITMVILNKNDTLLGAIITNNFINRCIDR